MRPSTLTTPTGKKWSINRIYYTPNPNDTVKFTTNLMGNLIYENIDRTFGYTYNGSGNISKITDKTGTASKDSTFVYDEANQLIRENNAYTNKTVTYTYDEGGNILAKTEYPFTTGSLDGLTGTVINYTYGNTNWKDLLTAYNGNDITYDEIGNPLTYYNGTQFTWYRGRKLETATTADGTSISYSYDDSGIRTQKTVDGVATDYFLDGSAIIAEKTGNDVKWYYYDGDGTREAIEYKGNVYYYFYNAQGDVMGLFDNNLNVVVNYTYDSWGNVVSISGSLAETLGKDNPFRYRGYYYDNETNLYYLNSRYYDANTGRFINADGLVQTGQGLLDKNMFAYCMNNPVNLSDENGELPIPFWAENILNGTACEADYNIALQCEPSLWIGYNRTCVDNAIKIANIHENSPFMFAEHHKRGTTNPSNREKHENANARRQRDNGGEKKNKNPSWKPNPNKRRNQNLEIAFSDRITYGAVALCATGAVVYLLANDMTGVGVVDDAYVAPLLPIIWDNTVKCFA